MSRNTKGCPNLSLTKGEDSKLLNRFNSEQNRVKRTTKNFQTKQRGLSFFTFSVLLCGLKSNHKREINKIFQNRIISF